MAGVINSGSFSFASCHNLSVQCHTDWTALAIDIQDGQLNRPVSPKSAYVTYLKVVQAPIGFIEVRGCVHYNITHIRARSATGKF